MILKAPLLALGISALGTMTIAQEAMPRLSREEAQSYAERFLSRPWPTEDELAGMAPFEGTTNTPVAECGKALPKEAVQQIFETFPSPERRLKIEVWEMMGVWQARETKDCSCAGKTPPWEAFPIIFRAVAEKDGEPMDAVMKTYLAQTLQEASALGRLCGGPY